MTTNSLPYSRKVRMEVELCSPICGKIAALPALLLAPEEAMMDCCLMMVLTYSQTQLRDSNKSTQYSLVF